MHKGVPYNFCDFSIGGAVRGRYIKDGKRQDGKMKVAGKKRFRKLTPIECERLQTVPDGFTAKGLATHYQSCHTDSIKKEKVCKPVNTKPVINQSQAGRLNSAINTTIDTLEQGLLKGENLSIRASNVLLKNAIGSNKLLKVTASSTISHGCENNLLLKLKNVNFVLKTLEIGGVECALDMQRQTNDMGTRYKLTLMNTEDLSHTGTMGENIIKIQMVDGLIELSLKKLLEDLSKKERLYIMLILKNLIIAKAIFLSVNQTNITSLFIGSSNKLQQNLWTLELLNLKMDYITSISNSARYKMLGNGWTVDVIAHILKVLKEICDE